MDQNDIIQRTAEYVRGKLQNDNSGHDWWHIHRVWKNALAICEHEKADAFIVQLAALLHDLDDWKFNASEDETPHRAKAWMEQNGIEARIIDQVCEIIMHISFKGAGVENKMKSIEGLIVQDADRLDAIGAVGIGRAFAYGGYKGRPLYDPNHPPQLHEDFEQYRNSHSATVNHFYEKLLLLKDKMNTVTARRIAQERHDFMLLFLEKFMDEWEGKDFDEESRE